MSHGYGTGPMEDALVRMKRMRAEMMQALDKELGPQAWAPAANERGVSSAGCNDGASDTVTLLSYTFPSTYPAARWQDAAAIVERVGRHYGFDVVHRTVDRPGNLDLTGLAPDGGTYTFSMASATVLSVQTGCYQWQKRPGPDAWLTIDPTPAR